MNAPYQNLQVPPRAQEKGGLEVLRAAVVEGELHVTLRRAFDDPQAWGVLLADVAYQVAHVYMQQGSTEGGDAVLAKIRDAFVREMARPSSDVSIGPIS